MYGDMVRVEEDDDDDDDDDDGGSQNLRLLAGGPAIPLQVQCSCKGRKDLYVFDISTTWSA